jgi:3-hydroxybutyryl-CoA dehydrogenase
MSFDVSADAPVLVVGAGIMGSGIAHAAAQAGHPVLLFDSREGVATEALRRLAAAMQSRVAKGKLASEVAAGILARVQPVQMLEAARDVRLVIEAIVENLEAKRGLFHKLESVVDERCILATNTSSISITALAQGLAHPGRVVGMHFFNPVPSMKLVEVVSGLHTDEEVATAVFELSFRWGKVPVHARSTPGFIVNRIARPFYAEALALLAEQAAEPMELDACLRGAGFRMGPCELMDLIGHDTNFAVTQSVFEANFFDKRYVPSLVQRELVDAGWLGRKSGRGFFDHREGAARLAPPVFEPLAELPMAARVVVHGESPVAERLAHSLTEAGAPVHCQKAASWIGLEVLQDSRSSHLRLTDGRPASQIGGDIAVFDLMAAPQAEPGAALAWAPASRASAEWVEQAPQWLRAAGFQPQRVADAPGLVVARTIAMLINEAADAVHQGVCTPEAADAAMKLGVNYPAGPFEWLARWDIRAVLGLLDTLDAHYRGERYRVSPGLRRLAWR